MEILRRIKKMVHAKNDSIDMAAKLDLCTNIIELSPQAIYILDKDCYLVDTYNMHKVEKIGILPDHVEIGKQLRDYATDESFLFYGVCDQLDQAITEVWENGEPVVLEYKILNSFLRATVSKLKNDRTLILVQDITMIMSRLQKLELSNNKELSMALTAGGLTSWSYDVKTRMLSSSHQNNTIGEKMPLDEMLLRMEPQYVQMVSEMFDNIIHHKIENGEITIRNMDLDGNMQWTNLHAVAHQYNSDGEVTTIVGSQKNINTEYEYNQKINNLNKQNELILNNIKSALVYITPDYKVVWENISKVFDYPDAKNYYRPKTYCYSAFHRDTPCENCVMAQALLSGHSESNEYTSKNGVVMEVVANPIIDKNGKIDGFVLKIDDVTAKKNMIQKLENAEREASATNKLLYTIIDNLPSYLFVKDANDDYRYLIVNKKFCEGFGISEKLVLGNTDYEIFSSREEADQYRSDDSETIELNQTKIIKEEHVTVKDDVLVWYTVKTPLINADNNGQRLLVGIGMDITENHRAYQELAIAKKKAEESDRLKSAFLANMSHEIRTPLNAIVGFSELLESCEDPAEKAEYVRIISTNNELLLRLINDILDLSKLDSGIAQLHITEFNLVEFFEELSTTMKQRITNPAIEFIPINPYQSCIISTDKARMTQVWNNFMTNAIKYTVSGYIKMGYEYVDNGIRIYVKDTGIGISDDKKSKLFQRFEKLDTFAQGTGLGLSICKAISELGGGKIGFESEEGKGSTFWSWKPIDAKIVYKDASDNRFFAEKGSELKMTDVEDYLKEHNCRILVAEDIETNYFLVKSILKEFDVSRAVNGAEAVEKVKNGNFDIVLMDMRMPLMGGIEATREIRKFNDKIVIIALTAHTSGADKQDALAAGCNHYLTKPTSKKKLFEALTLMV